MLEFFEEGKSEITGENFPVQKISVADDGTDVIFEVREGNKAEDVSDMLDSIQDLQGLDGGIMPEYNIFPNEAAKVVRVTGDIRSAIADLARRDQISDKTVDEIIQHKRFQEILVKKALDELCKRLEKTSPALREKLAPECIRKIQAGNFLSLTPAPIAPGEKWQPSPGRD